MAHICIVVDATIASSEALYGCCSVAVGDAGEDLDVVSVLIHVHAVPCDHVIKLALYKMYTKGFRTDPCAWDVEEQ